MVNDIFTHLDPVHMRDLRDEATEQMNARMLSFLAVLNYKHGMDQYVFPRSPALSPRFLPRDRRIRCCGADP